MERLTRELHETCDLFTGIVFVETPDALLSQILARKPVCRFVTPRLDEQSQKAVLAALWKTRSAAIITPSSVVLEGTSIEYTKVEIF